MMIQRDRYFVILLVVLAATSLAVAQPSDGETRYDDAPYVKDPWTLVNTTALPQSLQLSGVTQVGPFVIIVGGCLDIHCRVFSDAIYMYDVPRGKMWTPNRVFWNATNQSYTTATNSPDQPKAVLYKPIAGLHSLVSVKGSAFVMGPCCVVPSTNMSFLEETLKEDNRYGLVQRIRLVDPGGNDTAPSVDVSHYTDLGVSNARINASCTAHGSDSIFMVGGVKLSTRTNTSEFPIEVTRVEVNLARKAAQVQIHPQSFQIPEGVANPSPISDGETIYIIGGTNSDGVDVRTVTVYHAPTHGFILSLTKFKTIHNSSASHATVTGGNIVVSGSHYSTFESFSQREPNLGWIVTRNKHLEVRDGVTWAIPFDGQVLLIMFGGHNTKTSRLISEVYVTIIPPATKLLAGALFPITSKHGGDDGLLADTSSSPSPPEHAKEWQGLPILHWNETMQIVFDAEVTLANFSSCNTSHPSTDCRLRISSSSRCDLSLAEYALEPANLTLEPVRGGGIQVVGPELTLPAEPVDDLGEVTFIYGCYSPGLFGQPSSCASNPSRCVYSTRFYAAINAVNPSLILRRHSSHHPESSDSGDDSSIASDASRDSEPNRTISRSPVVDEPSAEADGWSTKKIVIVCVVSGLTVLGLAVCIKLGCCSGEPASPTSKSKTKTPLLDRLVTGYNGASTTTPTPSPTNGDGGVLLGDGRYKTLERLGRGSFSVVYLVERVLDRRKFALKYIQCPDEAERREAMKECEVIAKLRHHKNVIHLEDMFLTYKFDTKVPNSPLPRGGSNGHLSSPERHDSGLSYPESPIVVKQDKKPKAEGEEEQPSQQDGERFLSLVMEYHEQGDLAKWVRRKRSMKERIPEATIVSVAHQVCSVLHYMHTQNPPILHRDLKPENLLLSSIAYNNVASTFLPIVITDFGLSRIMDKAFCETGVGSLPYVAPECWKRHYTTKIDIWATGCILFAMCARRVEADNVVVMFSESNRPNFASFVFNSVVKTYGYSRELAHLITMCLEVDVNRRVTAEQCLECVKRRVAIRQRSGSGLSASSGQDTPGFDSNTNLNTRTSVTSSEGAAGGGGGSALEHYLVDVEQQEGIRSTKKHTAVAVGSPATPVTASPSKRKRTNTTAKRAVTTITTTPRPKNVTKRYSNSSFNGSSGRITPTNAAGETLPLAPGNRRTPSGDHHTSLILSPPSTPSPQRQDSGLRVRSPPNRSLNDSQF